MQARLAHIWRHPIKGIGAEPLERVGLTPGRPLPLDRAWAVLEDGGEAGPGWRSCRNFLRGAKGPSLMAVTARVAGDTIHLSHPDRPDLSVTPPEGATALFDWLRPIYPADRRPPAALVQSPPEGMSDAPFASVSVLNLSSLRALSQKVGQPLDPRRFRGNLWLDGLAPWEEFDLIGKTLAIGHARMEIVEAIGRCRATEANPDTGRRDAPTLQALEEGWGHTEFGVYATVQTGGEIALGDAATWA
ncbi:MOSC domain protein [Roseibacterium elongatum DSM 19469]|uniref:MOSC domain protein n=1 Tax=Roseicyclus elongatus DSM 19469 TaxID=1294273 RepID=W8S5A8_9RHOB|nr:MOSC N-terminal beta barrel domain-containing protein [Roseibacterium elongatum]AHM03986.1 MOSC domain protein [Roseibacterium elongatum DSM 19469]